MFFRLQEALQRNAELALAPSGYSANGEIMVAPAAAALSSRSSSTTTLQVIYDVHNGDKRPANLVCTYPPTPQIKVEKILKGSLDSIPSPSPSMKIQIMGGKV